MAVDDRMRAQARLILDSHPRSGGAPRPGSVGRRRRLDYLYREYAILVREPEADRVAEQLAAILDEAGYGDVPEDDAGRSSARRSPAGSSA